MVGQSGLAVNSKRLGWHPLSNAARFGHDHPGRLRNLTSLSRMLAPVGLNLRAIISHMSPATMTLSGFGSEIASR